MTYGAVSYWSDSYNFVSGSLEQIKTIDIMEKLKTETEKEKVIELCNEIISLNRNGKALLRVFALFQSEIPLSTRIICASMSKNPEKYLELIDIEIGMVK